MTSPKPSSAISFKRTGVAEDGQQAPRRVQESVGATRSFIATNISLNDQELRNSRYKGRFKQAAERFADNPLFQELGLFTARDIRRMLDVEFASELLLLLVEGVTNKKDLLEDAYARFELEFPDEARYEYEFNGALALVRAIAAPANATTIKTKSNFYSVFGACIEYLRSTNRTNFLNAASVSAAITELLDSARTGDLATKAASYAEYADAVSRAASDRGRRVRRQAIIFFVDRRVGPAVTARVDLRPFLLSSFMIGSRTRR